ncbi:MAG: CidA/LrgA family protein [Venatoribacter sp.]
MLGLLILLIFLVLGSVLQQLFHLPLPASILGMILLLITLLIRGKTPESLASISKTLSPLLPLFIIPVSVGLVTQKALLAEHGLLLVGILALSLIPGAIVTAWIMKGGKAEL